MGRITVSLPDDLEARLDTYATDKGAPVSHVVADALTAFLDASGGAPPPPPPPSSTGEDRDARFYFAIVVDRLEAIDQTLAFLASRVDGVPPRPTHPLPPPPWRTQE